MAANILVTGELSVQDVQQALSEFFKGSREGMEDNVVICRVSLNGVTVLTCSPSSSLQ